MVHKYKHFYSKHAFQNKLKSTIWKNTGSEAKSLQKKMNDLSHLSEKGVAIKHEEVYKLFQKDHNLKG